MSITVTEIEVSIGVTRSLGAGSYEFARIDVRNKATLQKGVVTGSPEYVKAHKDLVLAVQDMVEKAETRVCPEPKEDK